MTQQAHRHMAGVLLPRDEPMVPRTWFGIPKIRQAHYTFVTAARPGDTPAGTFATTALA